MASTFLPNKIRSLESRGVFPGGARGAMAWHTQILADQLTLSQPGGADYDHHISTGTPGFSDPPTALLSLDSRQSLSQLSCNLKPKLLNKLRMHNFF